MRRGVRVAQRAAARVRRAGVVGEKYGHAVRVIARQAQTAQIIGQGAGEERRREATIKSQRTEVWRTKQPLVQRASGAADCSKLDEEAQARSAKHGSRRARGGIYFCF